MGRGVSVPLSCRFFSVHCDSYPNGPMFRLLLQPSQPHSRQQYGGQNKEREQRMITNCIIRRVPRTCNTSLFFLSSRPELSQVQSTVGSIAFTLGGRLSLRKRGY